MNTNTNPPLTLALRRLALVFAACFFILSLEILPSSVKKTSAETWRNITVSSEEGNKYGIGVFTVGPNIPAEYGGTIYMAVMPDVQSDLGTGPGKAVTIKAESVNGKWDVTRTDGSTQGTGPGYGLVVLAVRAVNDDRIEGAHTSTIRIGYLCETDMSRYPSHTTQFTVTNHIKDNDTEGSISGSPIVESDNEQLCIHPSPAGTLQKQTGPLL